MQSLSETKILNFRPDTLNAVRKTCNLHKPGEMNEAVNILEDWMNQQSHFLKKDFDRSYLERAIIDAKGSVARAKERLEKLCTFRTLMPQYFGDFNIREDFQELEDKVMFSPLRELTEDHYRVIVVRNTGQKFESTFLLQVCRLACLGLEYLKEHEYNNGYIILFDHSAINWMELISKLQFTELRQGLAILLEGYGLKVKGIHFLTSSSLVDMAVTIVKQFLSAKIASRIKVHTTMETVYDYIPIDILPSDFGGKEKSLETLHAQCVDVFSSKAQREYVREMCKARTNESVRQTDKFNDKYIGTPGTFRTLSVD